MFEWNVAEMKLMNMSRDELDNLMAVTTTQDKVDFTEKIMQTVDGYKAGMLTYMNNLIEKFNEEFPGSARYNHHIAVERWLKKNDVEIIVDSDVAVGHFFVFSKHHMLQNLTEPLTDEGFCWAIERCIKEEKAYFESHDEYSVAKKRLRDLVERHNQTFGVGLSFCSNGVIGVCGVRGESLENSRPITLEEINLLLQKFEELEKTISRLSSELDIKY